MISSKTKRLTIAPPCTKEMKYRSNVLTGQYIYSMYTEVHEFISGLVEKTFQKLQQRLKKILTQKIRKKYFCLCSPYKLCQYSYVSNIISQR